MIRVLEVFHGMGCGGAENMIMNLYRNMDLEQIQFDFLVHTENKCFFDKEILERGGHIYRVPYYNGLNIVSYVKALNAFFDAHPEIKVVHGHLGSCANIYLMVAKRHGCFTIAHSHGTKPTWSFKNMIYRLNTYGVRRVADYFIGCGDAAGEYRYGKRIVEKSGRYSILNNAINTERFIYNESIRYAIRNQYGISDEMVLGHVGRFSYEKNHERLIEIFKYLVDDHPKAKLFLIGEGPLKEEIEKKVIQYSLSKNVIFTGLQKNVNEYLQAMDCFVFPSLHEGLPVTAIEAQASGLPCILSDTITKEVSITDLVNYVSLEKENAEWVKQIEQAIKNTKRRDRRQDIINAGYDINSTTEWLAHFYTEHSK